MGRGNQPREDLPPLRRIRPPPEPPATLESMQRNPKWIWLYCRACPHKAPTAIAPFVIRWGPNTPAAMLRRSARCSRCGAKGAGTMHPSWGDTNIGWHPFPVPRMAASAKDEPL